MSDVQSFPYHYYSCAIRSTAIENCVSGNFTSESHLNLIVAKNSRLEIFVVTAEGLRLIKEVSIYGKIAVMQLFRTSGYKKDFIFILTTRCNAMILEARGEIDSLMIHTRAHGTIADRMGKFSENGILAAIDPLAKVIALRLYNGVIKIIPIEQDNYELKAINLMIEEIEIQDLNFLHGCLNPTIVLLHQDSLGHHIKTHELCAIENEFIDAPWKKENLGMEAFMIIPVPEPTCGVIIIGQESVLYHNGITFIQLQPPILRNNLINCYAKVDSAGSRYLLGSMGGHIFMLLIEKEEKIDETYSVKDIKIDILGEVSIPECITYLDNGVFFVGSRMGDSQLVQLNKVLDDEHCSYITVLESFTNLAPIVDMIVVDLERQGQGQLITCSGGFKEGSIRIIRNGIGIQEVATVELAGIKGMWSLNISKESDMDNMLILSFYGHTRVLSLSGEEIEEIEIVGFLSNYRTLFCRAISSISILQVIPHQVRLISLEVKQILSEWTLPSGRNISNVAVNSDQVVCASGNEIYYLEVGNNEILQKSCMKLEHEIACIDISSFRDDTLSSEFVAVGLWNDISARIFLLPTLEEVHREYLGGVIIPRSVLFVTLEGIHYFLCALGDGSLLYFMFNIFCGRLLDRKRVTLGTKPLVLRSFKCMNTINVFVCSDRPAIIYSSNRKLVFSNINLKQVNCMCTLNSEGFPDNLALANDSKLMFGKIDEIQKLQIRSVPLYEGPRRIAHQECSETFGVITVRIDVRGPTGLEIQRECASTRAQIISNSQLSKLASSLSEKQDSVDLVVEVEVYHFLLFDQHTFEVLHAHQMLPNEYALSLISCKFANDANTYYVVGTGIVTPADDEPNLGRIIVFQVIDSKLLMISEKEVTGGCYSLVEFKGKLLASVNKAVRLFKWTSEKVLLLECSHINNILALFLKAKGDFVLVGDLMRAIKLLQYKTIEGTFEEIARDYNPNWMTAIEILDDDTFLGSENSYNLFICQKDSSIANDEERQLMQEVAQFHLGDMVNAFSRGSLVMQPLGEITIATYGSVLLGTVSGAVGIVTHIPRDLFDFLLEVQKKLSVIINSVGEIEHSFWRSFSSEVKTEPAVGFIDGDLVECFLDLPRVQMENIVSGLQFTVPMCRLGGGDDLMFGRDANEDVIRQKVNIETVIKIVEDLSKIR